MTSPDSEQKKEKKEDLDMKALLLALCLVVTAAFLAASPTLAAEYFVIKSRSGLLRVVDHQPKGGATIEKGPFATKAEAEKAMKDAETAKPPVPR